MVLGQGGIEDKFRLWVAGQLVPQHRHVAVLEAVDRREDVVAELLVDCLRGVGAAALYPRHIMWQPRAEAAAVVLLEGVEALVNADTRVERGIHIHGADDLALVKSPGDAPHSTRTANNGGQHEIRALGCGAWALGWWTWAHMKDLIVCLTRPSVHGSAKRGSGGGCACSAGHALSAEMMCLCCRALAAVMLCRGRQVGAGVGAGHVLAVLVDIGAGHVLAVLVS